MGDIKRKIAIYGGGVLAKAAFWVLQDLFQIECCYDNDEEKWGDFFYDLPIKQWTKTGLFIVITIKSWDEIAVRLEKENLRLGQDYIPYHFYNNLSYAAFYNLRKGFLCGKYLSVRMEYESFFPNKKLAVVYGNCQTFALEKALMTSKKFKEEFIVINIPKVYEYLYYPELVTYFLSDELFWEKVDLFIYQSVKKDNRFFEGLSSDIVISKLKENCKKVNIVNLCFYGYFPQVRKSSIGSGDFAFRDEFVDNMLEKGLDKKDILQKICSDTFISMKEIQEYINDSISELKAREVNADVKIADYIEKNYNKEQLFYSALHPCNKLHMEYIKRIFRYLDLDWNLSSEEFNWLCGVLKGPDCPIYPSVSKQIGLKRTSKLCLNNNFPRYMMLDFRQCMDLYIKVNSHK